MKGGRRKTNVKKKIHNICGRCDKVIHPNEIEAAKNGAGLFIYQCESGFWHTTKKLRRRL